MLKAILLAALLPASFAQLALPSPPWLPPDSSAGATPSDSKQPNSQWSTLLGNLIYFYDAQRSGKLPSSNRVSWRNDSAVDDTYEGGYYDAGDYVKFTYPLTFTLTSICWGAIDFGKGYDDSNQTPYLDAMLRWGLDWLIKAHPDKNTLIVQVGDSEVDNNSWGGDRSIPTPRPSFQIDSVKPGTDAAASAAAAFAACSLLYSGRRLSSNSSLHPATLTNQSYATTLLTHAQDLYNFAKTAMPQQTYSTAVPQSAASYGSSGYTDDLVLAALFVSYASNSTSVYSDGESLYKKSSLAGNDGVLNWDSKAPAIPVLGSQIMSVMPQLSNDSASSMKAWQTEAERYLDNIIIGKSRGFMTKGGLLFYSGDSDEASLNPALNAAMLLSHYEPLATSSEKAGSYSSFSKGQLDYALGSNPMSAPYIVGVNPNSPINPHSAMASGGSDINAIDTSPEREAYVIYGAVVGGPSKKDKFYDIRSDWPETEIALDYNAPLLTLAALNVALNPNDPFYTNLKAGAYDAKKPKGKPCDAAYPCHGGLSKAAKIAIGVIVSIVGLGIIGAICYIVWFRRGRRGKTI